MIRFLLPPLFLLSLLGMVFAALVAPFSVMAFDAPGSNQQWEAWAVMVGFMALPLVLFLLVVGGAVLAWMGWSRTAAASLSTPAVVGLAAVSLWLQLA
jgi:hypothetical protein